MMKSYGITTSWGQALDSAILAVVIRSQNPI